jgi:hypothetical protein
LVSLYICVLIHINSSASRSAEVLAEDINALMLHLSPNDSETKVICTLAALYGIVHVTEVSCKHSGRTVDELTSKLVALRLELYTRHLVLAAKGNERRFDHSYWQAVHIQKSLEVVTELKRGAVISNIKEPHVTLLVGRLVALLEEADPLDLDAQALNVMVTTGQLAPLMVIAVEERSPDLDHLAEQMHILARRCATEAADQESKAAVNVADEADEAESLQVEVKIDIAAADGETKGGEADDLRAAIGAALCSPTIKHLRLTTGQPPGGAAHGDANAIASKLQRLVHGGGGPTDQEDPAALVMAGIAITAMARALPEHVSGGSGEELAGELRLLLNRSPTLDPHVEMASMLCALAAVGEVKCAAARGAGERPDELWLLISELMQATAGQEGDAVDAEEMNQAITAFLGGLKATVASGTTYKTQTKAKKGKAATNRCSDTECVALARRLVELLVQCSGLAGADEHTTELVQREELLSCGHMVGTMFAIARRSPPATSLALQLQKLLHPNTVASSKAKQAEAAYLLSDSAQVWQLRKEAVQKRGQHADALARRLAVAALHTEADDVELATANVLAALAAVSGMERGGSATAASASATSTSSSAAAAAAAGTGGGEEAQRLDQQLSCLLDNADTQGAAAAAVNALSASSLLRNVRVAAQRARNTRAVALQDKLVALLARPQQVGSDSEEQKQGQVEQGEGQAVNALIAISLVEQVSAADASAVTVAMSVQFRRLMGDVRGAHPLLRMLNMLSAATALLRQVTEGGDDGASVLRSCAGGQVGPLLLELSQAVDGPSERALELAGQVSELLRPEVAEGASGAAPAGGPPSPPSLPIGTTDIPPILVAIVQEMIGGLSLSLVALLEHQNQASVGASVTSAAILNAGCIVLRHCRQVASITKHINSLVSTFWHNINTGAVPMEVRRHRARALKVLAEDRGAATIKRTLLGGSFDETASDSMAWMNSNLRLLHSQVEEEEFAGPNADALNTLVAVLLVDEWRQQKVVLGHKSLKAQLTELSIVACQGGPEVQTMAIFSAMTAVGGRMMGGSDVASAAHKLAVLCQREDTGEVVCTKVAESVLQVISICSFTLWLTLFPSYL